MSTRASMWAKQQVCGGTGPKLLLMMMADEADSLGHVFGYTVRGGQWNYGTQYYQELCECGDTSIKTWLKQLQSAQLIVKLEQGDRGGKRNKWRLWIPDDFARDFKKDSQPVPPVKGGADSDPQGINTGEEGGADSDLGQNLTHIEAESAPFVGQNLTPSLSTLLDPSVLNTPAASPSDVSAAPDSLGFVLDDQTLIGDLPKGDVKEMLPAELQRNWPFSFGGFPNWVPVLSFAFWADTCARNGKRIQPGQLPGMLAMVQSGAELVGITPAQYIGFHLDKGIRSFCQLSRTEVQNHFNPQPEKTAQDISHEDSSSSSATDENTDMFGDYSRFIEPAADGEGQSNGGADMGGYDEAIPGEVVKPDGRDA